jgi:cell division septation protein DedD
LFCAAILSGCAGVEETQQESQQPSEQQVGFEVKTDTVATRSSDRLQPAGQTERGEQVRYMVQIGAFKDPHSASRVQNTARERYRMPVLNDYHPVYALYQIRIGFFETREAATAFRNKLRSEYPADYADAWVVQLRR